MMAWLVYTLLYGFLTISEADVKQLVVEHIQKKLGDIYKVLIEVKSKQNFKSEWENATCRARYQATT
jgi:hypothetical protein